MKVTVVTKDGKMTYFDVLNAYPENGMFTISYLKDKKHYVHGYPLHYIFSVEVVDE